jgi:hypothetical protein
MYDEQHNFVAKYCSYSSITYAWSIMLTSSLRTLHGIASFVDLGIEGGGGLVCSNSIIELDEYRSLLAYMTPEKN